MPNTRANFREDLRDGLIAVLKARGSQVNRLWDVNQTCVAYFNTRLRVIPAAPRRVVWSAELLAKRTKLRRLVRRSLARIETEATVGADLARYHSKRIASPTLDDPLLNDWGIHHLHLGVPVSGSVFSNRTSELLFVHATERQIYFVDVLRHGDWSRRSIVETMHANWPDLMQRFRLQGITPPVEASRLSDDEIAQLRRAGVTIIHTGPDGGAFVGPGHGASTSGLNLRVRTDADRLLDDVEHLQRLLEGNAAEVAAQISAATGARVELPLNLRLLVEERNGRLELAFHEQRVRCSFVLSTRPSVS